MSLLRGILLSLAEFWRSETVALVGLGSLVLALFVRTLLQDGEYFDSCDLDVDATSFFAFVSVLCKITTLGRSGSKRFLE